MRFARCATHFFYVFFFYFCTCFGFDFLICISCWRPPTQLLPLLLQLLLLPIQFVIHKARKGSEKFGKSSSERDDPGPPSPDSPLGKFDWGVAKSILLIAYLALLLSDKTFIKPLPCRAPALLALLALLAFIAC